MNVRKADEMRSRLRFECVDFENHSQLCFQFRKDAHIVSYGDESGFHLQEMNDWFQHLLKDNVSGFRHVWLDNQIIGQLEYKTKIMDQDESNSPFTYSYINLFYLASEMRNQGIGQHMHDFVINECRQDGSQEIYLRYVPGNKQAKAFYRKNGWLFSGEPDTRGQLMVLDLTSLSYSFALVL